MSTVQYFKATEIAKDSYQIEYAFTDREHVYCYLVIGRDRALVIDTMYGGHQVLPPSVIDEGIELAARVLAGTDDKEELPGMFGGTVTYAAKHATAPSSGRTASSSI